MDFPSRQMIEALRSMGASIFQSDNARVEPDESARLHDLSIVRS
jgi:hypothetical protein